MAITPYLYYEDVNAALKWLAMAFGFKPYGARNTGPDGKIDHAAMQYGDAIVMMGRPAPKLKYRNPRRLGQATQSLYVNVEDVDEHFQRAKRAGATILEESAETGYGHLRYGAEDSEGHQWYFAQELKTRARRRRG
jgi:uncharacterized glyoxalase superfamily protein PhnB